MMNQLKRDVRRIVELSMDGSEVREIAERMLIGLRVIEIKNDRINFLSDAVRVLKDKLNIAEARLRIHERRGEHAQD